VVKRHLSEAVVLDWPSASLADVDTPEDFKAAAMLFDEPKA
jgi:2-phospho-L-lactate guanylyltransferase (CobY/MobA/RfbA family)